MCAAFALTVKILEAAGPDLTPESFITGGESLGNFVLPWIGEASITPDKHSAGSNVQRYVFFPDDGFWNLKVTRNVMNSLAGSVLLGTVAIEPSRWAASSLKRGSGSAQPLSGMA